MGGDSCQMQRLKHFFWRSGETLQIPSQVFGLYLDLSASWGLKHPSNPWEAGLM